MTEILKNEERVIFELRKLYSQYGYQPFKMSRFEEYDLYVRNKDFLLSDQVITFSDRTGKLLALKPDVTLSIIKNVQDIPGTVQKVYYNENVYRTDRSSHDFKEIMQAGLECVGDLSLLETAEVVLLAAKSLAIMNRPFVLDISHMGLLTAILDDSGLGKDVRKKAMTFLHQKNTHEMQKLCVENECDQAVQKLLCTLTTLSGPHQIVIPILSSLLFTQKQKKLLSELQQICSLLSDRGFDDRINVDFSAGSQMKYYSGIVFCGYLQGIPNVVLSGGQYDALLQKMKKNSKAIGFAIYLDLLQRIQDKGQIFDIDTILLYSSDDPVDIVMDIAANLRNDVSVLVARSVPKNLTCRRLMIVKERKAELLEEYG